MPKTSVDKGIFPTHRSFSEGGSAYAEGLSTSFCPEDERERDF